MLPDFIVIGAMKCGTTSLYNYLNEHPNVVMSVEKEPSYFCHNYYKGLSWYKSQFPDNDSCLIGEASTQYTKYPIHKEVPSRINALLPSVKLIYVVRDPVERMLSHYVHARSHDEEKRQISECIHTEEKNPYVAYSSYAFQIKRYLEYFDNEQLLIVDSHELKNERESVLEEIFNFIGATPEYIAGSDFSAEANKSAGATERNRLISSLVRVQWVHGAYASLPEKARSLLKPFYRSPLDKPELSQKQKEELYDYFKPEVRWLREFSGLKFSSWGV